MIAKYNFRSINIILSIFVAKSTERLSSSVLEVMYLGEGNLET